MFVKMHQSSGRDNSIFNYDESKTPFMQAFPSFKEIERQKSKVTMFAKNQSSNSESSCQLFESAKIIK